MASSSNAVQQSVAEAVEVQETQTTVVATGKKTKASKPKTVAAKVDAVESTDNPQHDEVSSLRVEITALTERVKALEEALAAVTLKTQSTEQTDAKVKKDKEEKKPRPPTAYNIFMKAKMVELKESHPTLNNIDRMKLAAEAWTESKKS